MDVPINFTLKQMVFDMILHKATKVGVRFYNYILLLHQKGLRCLSYLASTIVHGSTPTEHRYQLGGLLTARILFTPSSRGTGMACPHLSGKKIPSTGPCLVRDTRSILYL